MDIIIIIKSILSLAFLVGLFFLQAFLSKKDIPWSGWVLPVVTFIVSVVTFFSGIGLNGLKSSAVMFGVINIGTLMFILIHLGCHSKQMQKAQLDKMNIQDLN